MGSVEEGANMERHVVEGTVLMFFMIPRTVEVASVSVLRVLIVVMGCVVMVLD